MKNYSLQQLMSSEDYDNDQVIKALSCREKENTNKQLNEAVNKSLAESKESITSDEIKDIIHNSTT